MYKNLETKQKLFYAILCSGWFVLVPWHC